MHQSSTFSLLGLVVLLSSLQAESPSPIRPHHELNWKEEYGQYRQLPHRVRQQMRDLDRDLRQMDDETRAGMIRVMRRYQEWLDRLSEEDRSYIEGADSPPRKVERIREIREKQWLATLPKKDRDRVAAAAAEERRQVIAELRKREEDRELEWHLAEVRQEEREELYRWQREQLPKWLQRELNPKLSQKDKQRLRQASRLGPIYYRLMIELAKEHGVAVPAPLEKLQSSFRVRSRTPRPDNRNLRR